MSNIISFPRKSPADFLSSHFASPVSRIGVMFFDRPDMPPLVKLLYLLDAFAEVPLPDGRLYQLRGRELRVKQEGEWQTCETTVNDLLRLVSGLTHAQWLNIKQRSVMHNLLTLRDWAADRKGGD
jgi:hypothetical protein